MIDNKDKVIAKLEELLKEYEGKAEAEARKIEPYKRKSILDKETLDFIEEDMNEYHMNAECIYQVIEIIKNYEDPNPQFNEITFDEIEPLINEIYSKASKRYDELKIKLDELIASNQETQSVGYCVADMKKEMELMKKATKMERFAIFAITEVMYD